MDFTDQKKQKRIKQNKKTLREQIQTWGYPFSSLYLRLRTLSPFLHLCLCNNHFTTNCCWFPIRPLLAAHDSTAFFFCFLLPSLFLLWAEMGWVMEETVPPLHRKKGRDWLAKIARSKRFCDLARRSHHDPTSPSYTLGSGSEKALKIVKSCDPTI